MAINDNKKTFYNNVNINDGEILWLVSQGIVRSTLPDMWRRYLITQGYTTGTIIDRLYSFFGSRGYTGTFSNRYNQFFLNLSDPGASTLALLNSLQVETDGFVINWAQGNSGIIKAVNSQPNLPSNPNFDTDTVWSKFETTISGGTANFSGVANGYILQSCGIVIGRSYTITFDVVSVVTAGTISVRFGNGYNANNDRVFSAPGTYTTTAEAIGGVDRLQIENLDTFEGSIDNIVCTEIDLSLPIQELTQQDIDILDYTSPSKKYITGPDGNQRYAAHNLWPYSEDWPSNGDGAGPVGCTVSGNEITVTASDAYDYRHSSNSLPVGNYKVMAVVSCDTTVSDAGFRTVVNTVGQDDLLVDFVADVQQTISLDATVSAADQVELGLDCRAAVVSGAGDLTGAVVTIHKVWVFNAPCDTTYLKTTGTARYAIPQTHDASKHTTSSSNLMLTLGEKAVTLATSQTYAVGDNIKIWNADGFQMSGTVKSGSGTSYIIDVEHIIAGTGSKSSWHISPILGRLCEPAATNLDQYSEEADNAYWTKARLTVTANATTGPNGETTADELFETTDNSNHLIRSSVNATWAEQRVVSRWIKDTGDGRFLAIRFLISSTVWETRVFDPATGTVTQTSSGSGSTFTSVDSGVITGANGWYRIWMTANASATVQVDYLFCTTGTPTLDAGSGHELYAGDTSKSMYFGPHQFETGSYPTSDIHTVGSTVTRLADDQTKPTSELPWADGDAGSIVIGLNTRSGSTGNYHLGGFNNGSADRILLYKSGGDVLQFISDSSVAQTNNSLGALAPDTDHKVAMAWDTNDVQGALNGTAASADTSASIPNGIVEAHFGQSESGAQQFNGVEKYFIYRARRISEADLELETAA